MGRAVVLRRLSCPPVKLLLDTHAVLWWATGSKKLSKKAASAISSPANEPFLSAVSAWEIAVKLRKGTLTLPRHLAADIPRLPARLGFPVLEMRWAHAERAASWDIAHGDPFDRILAAQSEIENIPLVTCDPAFLEFGTKTLW
jgi:PIN domain nuclease of toxin-antitoxin system